MWGRCHSRHTRNEIHSVLAQGLALPDKHGTRCFAAQPETFRSGKCLEVPGVLEDRGDKSGRSVAQGLLGPWSCPSSRSVRNGSSNSKIKDDDC